MTSAPAGPLARVDDRVQLAAALATHFDPFAVLGVETRQGDGRTDALDGLAAVCDEVEVPGSSYRHWTMRPEARLAVLRAAAGRPDFTSLVAQAAPAADDHFATYLRQGLLGEDLGDLLSSGGDGSPDGALDLDGLLLAARLLQGLPRVATDADELERRVRRAIARTQRDEALRTVAPERLIGRRAEYDALLRYRAAALSTDADYTPAFVLVGAGGVGKSALVSRFVLDQRALADAAPVVYLDFDRATLVGATPLDLTFELTRQLGLADADLDETLHDFRAQQRLLVGRREDLGIDSRGGVVAGAHRELGSLLSSWRHRSSPVLVVADTFEEVAIRGVTAVRDVLDWVADLRVSARLDQLHLVVCGRAVRPDAPHLADAEIAAMFNEHTSWELDDLPVPDAVAMLAVLGVDQWLAQRLPPVFGGNPLVLKLLHRFVSTNSREEVEQLVADGVAARRTAPTGEVGLRFVYERILNRIRNRRVRALAYPGVVLRRVTPELILDVLAPTSPVPLDVTTPAEAEQAFAELADHVWLVTRVAPDTVVHRADVRRLLVPGLELSADVDTERIHRAAARYYARRPLSVPEGVAAAEEVYHRGFLDDVPEGMSEPAARAVLRDLAADVEFWPVHARAMLKSLAGRHLDLTEEEVSTLASPQQALTRGHRLTKYVSSSDLGAADFEDERLGQLAPHDTIPIIPAPRWALLFDRGDLDFMTESSRVLTTFDRYFRPDPERTSPVTPTREPPWYLALAIVLADRGGGPVLSPSTLDTMASWWPQTRLYAAAVAGLTGDRHASSVLLPAVGDELPPRIDVATVDDAVLLQAAAAGGRLDDPPGGFRAYSYDLFRLPHVAAIATQASDRAVADSVRRAVAEFAADPPDTLRLNQLRSMLAQASIDLPGFRSLRSAPTVLPFLYGAIRTVLTGFDRAGLLALVADLEGRSVFWPRDLTAAALDSALRSAATATDLTALIETADRCGLILDLVDGASARSAMRLSRQLVAGMRRIEGALFPYAAPREALAGID